MIHNHPEMEKERGIDKDHVIIDRNTFVQMQQMEAPRIRVLKPNELLMITSPNEVTNERAHEILKRVSKARRFVFVHGYDLFVVQKSEQVVVEKKGEENVKKD